MDRGGGMDRGAGVGWGGGTESPPAPGPYVDPAAEVTGAVIGRGTRVWAHALVREGATVGEDCIVATGAYVDRGVSVGSRVKIENQACLFRGAVVDDGAFIGPHACLANDRRPRSLTPAGKPKADADWVPAPTRVGRGASIGAGAIVLPGVSVGPWAMVGAGAVVTRDVPPHALVAGNPARIIGSVCECGERLGTREDGFGYCPACGYHRLSGLPVSRP